MNLKESIVTFTEYPPKGLLKKAKEKMEGLSEVEIINLAKKGDNDAINYIFDKTRRQIAKAFWQYYLGPNPQFKKVKIKRGEAATYLSMVIEGLKSKDSNPLLTFDPSKYKEGDIINKLGYYIYRYAQNWAFKAIRSDKNLGIKQVGDSEISSVSLGRTSDDKNSRGFDIGVKDSSLDDVDIQDTFSRWFKRIQNPQDKKIMKLRLQGVSDPKEIAKIVFPGKSSGHIMVYQRLKKLLSDFKTFSGLT